VARPGPHEWNRLGNYLQAHHSALDAISFVIEDGIAVEQIEGRDRLIVRLAGRIVCRADVVVEVDKYLDTRGGGRRLEVRGRLYQYNAYVGGRLLLRYGNCYPHIDPDQFHRHIYDVKTGVERLEERRILGRDEFPVLSRVVEEIQPMIMELGIEIDW
jgi:hypothetical protein